MSSKTADVLAEAAIAIGIFALTAFIFYLTQNGLSFLILFLLSGIERLNSFKTKCPKCDHEFAAEKLKGEKDE